LRPKYNSCLKRAFLDDELSGEVILIMNFLTRLNFENLNDFGLAKSCDVEYLFWGKCLFIKLSVSFIRFEDGGVGYLGESARTKLMTRKKDREVQFCSGFHHNKSKRIDDSLEDLSFSFQN
jgi:hypothetical protein